MIYTIHYQLVLYLFTAGGCASIVGQTLAVPLDIVTQHLMLMGRREKNKGLAFHFFYFTLTHIQMDCERIL